jgi:undecaprenyl-phosphate galactose phosphotransferase
MGDMSLVGPRPIVEDEVERYGSDFQYFCSTKPGITGLWQISGRSNIDYDERIRLDKWYIRNWSIWQDIVILVKSIPIVLRKTGAY